MAKVAILGRTRMLVDSAAALVKAGHDIAMVATNPGPPAAGYDVPESEFEELAASAGCAFISCNRLDPELHLQTFEESGAAIAISVNWKTIIHPAFVAAFPLGILNAHGGDLPRYRGNACQAWAILNGEDRVGLCVHKMVGGELDSGDIIARDRLAIDANTGVGQVIDWMTARTPHLFVEAVNRLVGDPGFVLEAQSKEASAALRCFPRRPEDGRILWSQRARDVARLVKASGRPYAGAFCFHRGRKVVVWDVAGNVEEGPPFCAVPGQVLASGPAGLDIACGEGKVRLTEVEVDGEVMPASQLTQSLRDRLE